MNSSEPKATGIWKALKGAPQPGHSYLIAARFGGLETFDVAFYNGRKPNGDHWWTLGNVNIDPGCIEYYAEIEPPKY